MKFVISTQVTLYLQTRYTVTQVLNNIYGSVKIGIIAPSSRRIFSLISLIKLNKSRFNKLRSHIKTVI
jgi:hypothetical protein